MVMLDGLFRTPEEVQAELGRVISAPSRARRHFAKTPFLDVAAGKTYVLFRGWGLETEPTLTALAAAFPKAEVGFRRAEE